MEATSSNVDSINDLADQPTGFYGFLDCDITALEVMKAVDDAKINKAAETDCIPTEVLKGDMSDLLFSYLSAIYYIF